MVLRAEEELVKTLQRAQRRQVYFSSQTDRLEKYFFMFKKSILKNKNWFQTATEQRKGNSRVVDVFTFNADNLLLYTVLRDFTL